MSPLSIAALGRAIAIAACLAVAGCSAGAASTGPALTSGPAAVPSTAAPGSPSDATASLNTPTPTEPAASPSAPTPTATTPSATPVPSPTERVYASPRPTSIKSGDVVETLVGDVRVRSKPRVTDSVKYEPLLSAGTKLYVLDGPVAGSGYQWFWVAQLSSTELPSGWVAAAGRDGEPWLGPSDYDCPPVPDDFKSLLALPRGVRSGVLLAGADHLQGEAVRPQRRPDARVGLDHAQLAVGDRSRAVHCRSVRGAPLLRRRPGRLPLSRGSSSCATRRAGSPPSCLSAPTWSGTTGLSRRLSGSPACSTTRPRRPADGTPTTSGLRSCSRWIPRWGHAGSNSR